MFDLLALFVFRMHGFFELVPIFDVLNTERGCLVSRNWHCATPAVVFVTRNFLFLISRQFHLCDHSSII